MRVQLHARFDLTTDHAASSHGAPVLAHRTTRQAYGPADLVQVYASYGLLPAAEAVRRLARSVVLNEDGRALVQAFVGNKA